MNIFRVSILLFDSKLNISGSWTSGDVILGFEKQWLTFCCFLSIFWHFTDQTNNWWNNCLLQPHSKLHKSKDTSIFSTSPKTISRLVKYLLCLWIVENTTCAESVCFPFCLTTKGSCLLWVVMKSVLLQQQTQFLSLFKHYYGSELRLHLSKNLANFGVSRFHYSNTIQLAFAHPNNVRLSRGSQMWKYKPRCFSEQCTQRKCCVSHTYPAAEAPVCKTLRSTGAKDNHWTIFLCTVTQGLLSKRGMCWNSSAHVKVLWHIGLERPVDLWKYEKAKKQFKGIFAITVTFDACLWMSTALVCTQSNKIKDG